MNIVYVDIYSDVMWLAIVRAVEKPSRPGWIWVLILLMQGCRWMHGICHAMNIHVLCSFWRYLKIIRAYEPMRIDPFMCPCSSLPSFLHPFPSSCWPVFLSMYWVILICLFIQYVLQLICIITLDPFYFILQDKYCLIGSYGVCFCGHGIIIYI